MDQPQKYLDTYTCTNMDSPFHNISRYIYVCIGQFTIYLDTYIGLFTIDLNTYMYRDIHNNVDTYMHRQIHYICV